VRWSQIRTLNFILKAINITQYDAVIFLSYETISLSLRWPSKFKVFLFEHNNIDNAKNSVIKRFFYRNLPSLAIHLVFQNHIKDFIENRSHRRAEYLPHPYYQTDFSEKDNHFQIIKKNPKKKIIFSPSASTPENLQKALIAFAGQHNCMFQIICKGSENKCSENHIVRPFFDDYEKMMKDSDYVFLGKKFDYRVSGVAFEALSYGKTVIMKDCLFAQELREKYPNMVRIIYRLEDLLYLRTDTENLKRENERFIVEHCFDNIVAKTSNIINPKS
jgi:hypothetical protein